MLSALGVDVDAYLHSERIVDIHEQMKRCSDCAQTAECDEKLSSGAVDPDGIAFCDNEESLREMLDKERTTAPAER